MARKSTIPIYDGDDFEKLAALRQNVTIAERKAEEEADRGVSRRIGDDEPTGGIPDYLQAARDAYDAFVDEAVERAEMWVLEPIGHEEFRALLKEHQPRKTTGEDGKEVVEPTDAAYGVNVETFPKALLTYIDPEDDEIRTIAEPVFESPTAMRRRVKRLSAGEFETLWTEAYLLNRRGVQDPKLLRFSPTASRSGEI